MTGTNNIFITTILSFIPIIVFWVVEENWGLQAGIIAALIAGILEVGYWWIKEKRLDKIALFSTVLIILMGIISYFTQSSFFIKLKPAIMEAILAIILIGSSIMGKPLLIEIAKKQLGNQLKDNYLLQEYLKGVNIRFAVAFLIHAILTAYAAMYLSTKQYTFFKIGGFYAYIALYFVFELIYGRVTMMGKAKKAHERPQFLAWEQRRNIENNTRGEV